MQLKDELNVLKNSLPHFGKFWPKFARPTPAADFWSDVFIKLLVIILFMAICSAYVRSDFIASNLCVRNKVQNAEIYSTHFLMFTVQICGPKLQIVFRWTFPLVLSEKSYHELYLYCKFHVSKCEIVTVTIFL